MTQRDPAADAALAKRFAALAPAQQELLRRQLAARGVDIDALVKANQQNEAHAADNGRLPLTPAQSHLWVVHQLQPDASAYHIALRWDFGGDLDRIALQRALNQLIERHAALRTEFVSDEGRPWQRVRDDIACALAYEPGAADEESLQQQIRAIVCKPFDLQCAPLLRAHLLRVDEHHHVLVLVLHHLIADGWSRGVLLRELSAFYRASIGAATADIAPLPVQYSDYVKAQQQWLRSADCERQTAYWKRQLQGIVPLDLVTDHARTPQADYRSRTLSLQLSTTQRDRLQQAARRNGATPFMLLLAVFNVLLHRYSGHRDIAVGIPVAGRHLPASLGAAADVSGLIGFFVNTLVIRSRPQEASQFGHWLDAVRQAIADAFDNQDLPFANMVEAANVARDPSRAPLFDIMFQYQSDSYRQQNAESLDDAFPGLRVEQKWVELEHTKFDQSWHVLDRESGLLIAVEYRSALFNAARIERQLAHFATLLDAVLDAGEVHVGRLPLLTQAETSALTQWQQGPVVAAANEWHSIVTQFERIARAQPDAIAVAASGFDSLSYAALNAAANRFARRLQALGIQQEALVGICLPRTPDLLVALLGTLKAGAAYVPLDPVLPIERLRYMASDAQLAVCVTTAADAQRLGDICDQLLPIDDKTERATQQALATDNLYLPLQSSQLAYVIYTSGSTGKPKGTLLPHAGLVHYLDWCLARYPLQQGDGAPVASSIGFDATITALYAPLLAGRTVTMLADSGALETLAQALTVGHSLMKLTPAHLSALQPLLETQASPRNLPAAFIIGGEALTEAHIAFWRERYPSIRLVNEYGPTETVVGCAYYEATASDRGAIPIGLPIANAAIYVLDDYLNPVPVGVAGEIYIGGAGMARGYLNRASLSASRFMPDPFATQAGAVMYRSGDLGVRRDDGVIVYLGRADQQLQLRGYRIEAGEIESALCRQGSIAEAVVLQRDAGAGTALVAYMRLQDAAGDASEVIAQARSALAHWLPSYMVPAHFVALDAFPLTSNGKVDRAALPAPQLAPVGSVAASSDNEQLLLDIWRAVLRRNDIGVHDNFFDAGGDSVSAMQIVARARQAGLDLAPAAIFDNQTVAAQASIAKPLQAQAALSRAEGVAPLAPLQWDFWQRVQSGDYPDPAHFNQSLLLDVDSTIDIEMLHTALQQLGTRHDALRLRYRHTAAGWEQYYATRCDIALQVDELPAASAALEALLAQSQRGLDLQQGPLLRALLLRSGDAAKLFLIAHHLIVDGVSWRLLLADLAAIYHSLAHAAPMPASWQAPAFAAWTAQLSAALPHFSREQNYWQAQCAAVAPLPGCTTLALEAVSTVLEIALDENLSLALHKATARLDANADEIVLTALSQTLCGWLLTDTLVIEVEGHGRQRWFDAVPDMSTAVGWFTALYPLRLQIPPAAPQVQLARVRDHWRAVPNHGIGYGVLRMHDKLSTSSPAQVLFNYLGRTDSGGLGFIRGMAADLVPAQRSPQARRTHALEVIARVQDNRLQLLWRYAPEQLAPALVAQLAQRTVANLQTLLATDSSANNNSANNNSINNTAASVAATPAAANTASSSSAAAQALLARLKKQ